MLELLSLFAWLACSIYSTIPAFWLLIHPRAERWRARPHSPYKVLLPTWAAMWILTAAATTHWRHSHLYNNRWALIPSGFLFCVGIVLYKLSHAHFSLRQLGGLPEVLPGQSQRLVTSGIRARLRHPVYLAHLCEMLAWSLASGLVVCFVLTTWAVVTGAVMIKMEDRELQKRFGEKYRVYCGAVPRFLPKLRK